MMTEADLPNEPSRSAPLLQLPITPRVSECRECGKGFEYEPVLMFGREICKPNVCAGCDEIVDQRRKVERAEQQKKEALEVFATMCPPTYLESDVSRFPSRQWEQALEWQPGSGRSLLLHGVTNRFKTRIAWELLRRMFLARYRLESDRNDDILIALTAAQFSRASSDYASDGASQAWANRLLRVRLLFLDDLGKGRLTERNESDLFDILDRRFAYQRACLITTNTVGSELEKRLDPDRGTPLVRRLREFCDCISF